MLDRNFLTVCLLVLYLFLYWFAYNVGTCRIYEIWIKVKVLTSICFKHIHTNLANIIWYISVTKVLILSQPYHGCLITFCEHYINWFPCWCWCTLPLVLLPASGGRLFVPTKDTSFQKCLGPKTFRNWYHIKKYITFTKSFVITTVALYGVRYFQ